MSEYDGTMQDDLASDGCCAPEPAPVEPVPIVDEVPTAPAPEEIAPAPVIEEAAPATAVESVTPQPVVETAAPQPVSEAPDPSVPATGIDQQPAPQPTLDSGSGVPLVIESGTGMQPAAEPLSLADAISGTSAQTGVSLNPEGGLVIGPDPNDTYVHQPMVRQWSPELSEAAQYGPAGPTVNPESTGLGAQVHPYGPNVTRHTNPDGSIEYYGEGYIGPVNPRIDNQ